ncbi:MAG: biopolymer transporter ExbD [Opitutaceae bacterium]|jgi:biopolymer transport protein ExbD|nr:biopolymer transporter ExbD [Opitutaceae bacterium]
MADKSAGTPFDTDAKKKARIEIIPLIDVIFFLLATFVLFSLSLNKIQSMETKLPVTSDPDPNRIKDDEPLIIQVSGGTSVYIAREPADMADVYSRIMHYKESTTNQGKTPRVLISGDERAKYRSLIKALDIAKAADVEQISFETNYRASGK